MTCEGYYLLGKKLQRYVRSDSEGKAAYILSNYERFPKMIAGYKSIWEIIVKAEKRYNASLDYGNPGIRVQSSGNSDPTMTEAMTNIEIESATSEAELRDILKGTDNPEQHLKERLAIRSMQDDYTITRNVIHALEQRDEELFLKYLRRKGSLQEIADEYHVELSTCKKRIYRIKKTVMKSAMEYIDLKEQIVLRRKTDDERKEPVIEEKKNGKIQRRRGALLYGTDTISGACT